MRSLNDLSYAVNGAAMDVHRELGPGLLESVYEAALAQELASRDICFARQAEIPVSYKGSPLADCGFRADFVVEERLILEIKAVDQLLPIHEAQLLNYLKATQIEVGLLLNFGPKPKLIRKLLTNDRK